jgi:hypothetical protein
MTFLQINIGTRKVDVTEGGKAVSNSIKGFFRIPVTELRACVLDERSDFLSLRMRHETLNLHSTGWKWVDLLDAFVATTEALMSHYADRPDMESMITITETGNITTLVNLYYDE